MVFTRAPVRAAQLPWPNPINTLSLATSPTELLTAVRDMPAFNAQFISQFEQDPILGLHVLFILRDFFRDITAPGLLVYSEHVAANVPGDRETSMIVRAETEIAHRVAAQIFPPPEFYAIAIAVDDSTNHSQSAPFVDEYLSILENARITIADRRALESLPSGAFSGAYGRGSTFVMSASEVISKVSELQRQLLQTYLESKLNALGGSELLRSKYRYTLK